MHASVSNSVLGNLIGRNVISRELLQSRDETKLLVMVLGFAPFSLLPAYYRIALTFLASTERGLTEEEFVGAWRHSAMLIGRNTPLFFPPIFTLTLEGRNCALRVSVTCTSPLLAADPEWG